MKKLIVLVLLAASFQASGNEPALSSTYNTCMDGAGGVTSNMLDCIGAETKTQDIRLNKAYKDVAAKLKAPRKKSLQEAQRSWLKFRDANCGFYADPDGGTIASVISSDCFMTTTASRAKEI